MFILYDGAKYKISFVHHNPARKPKNEIPANVEAFTGTKCTIQAYVDDVPGAYVVGYATLGKEWKFNPGADVHNLWHRRYDQFVRKTGRMISLRRAAKLMFGKSHPAKPAKDGQPEVPAVKGADEFIQAYLTARYDYTNEKDLGY